MKKKVFSFIAFAAIAAVAGWNYNQNMNNVNLSDLALENVEALANGESEGNVRCCIDPGDTCVLSTGDILQDFDEC